MENEIEDKQEESEYLNDNSNKAKLWLIILAGILTIIPISSLILELIEMFIPSLEFSESVYLISFYICKMIGFSIYFLVLKMISGGRITLSVISGILLLFNWLMYNEMNNMPNKGIDSIGEAILLAAFFNGSLYIYYFLAIVLLIMNMREYKKRK